MRTKRLSFVFAAVLAVAALAAPAGMFAADGSTVMGFSGSADCSANAIYAWREFDGAKGVSLSVVDLTTNATVASVTEAVAGLQFKSVVLPFTAVSGDVYQASGYLTRTNGGIISASQNMTGQFPLC
jgi:hypothetical protein